MATGAILLLLMGTVMVLTIVLMTAKSMLLTGTVMKLFTCMVMVFITGRMMLDGGPLMLLLTGTVMVLKIVLTTAQLLLVMSTVRTPRILPLVSRLLLVVQLRLSATKITGRWRRTRVFKLGLLTMIHRLWTWMRVGTVGRCSIPTTSRCVVVSNGGRGRFTY